MDFPKKLLYARSALGLTQEGLAKRAGISLRTVQGYEQGVRTARKAHLLRVAKVLNVSTKYLADSSCNDPREGIDEDEEAIKVIPSENDLNNLTEKCSLCFTSNLIPQEKKDDFFTAILRMYLGATIYTNPDLESMTTVDVLKTGIELGMKIALTIKGE